MNLRLKTIVTTVSISLSIVATTFLFPYGFSAIHRGWAADFWLFITHSGGSIGVPIITTLFCLIISLHYIGWPKKILALSISLIVFAIILGGFAQINEYVLKEELRIKRPNIVFLDNEYQFDSETFYSFNTKAERRHFLKTFLEQKDDDFIQFNNKSLHPDVIKHWIHETGFSFPSGHSVNAFLMATLMAYIILFVYSDFRRRRWFIAPFVWAILVAISRVILGVHSPVDITVGAFHGIAMGLIIILSSAIDKYLRQKSVH